MSENYAYNSELHILFVDCAPDSQFEAPPNSTKGLKLFKVPMSSDIQEMMMADSFDCVMIRVNPGCRENLSQMKAVRNSALEHKIPLVSLSTFNAIWIENLMGQLGVQKHFRQIPTHEELSNVLIKFASPVNEQVKGAPR